jgi:hypothetical protein
MPLTVTLLGMHSSVALVRLRHAAHLGSCGKTPLLIRPSPIIAGGGLAPPPPAAAAAVSPWALPTAKEPFTSRPPLVPAAGKQRDLHIPGH